MPRYGLAENMPTETAILFGELVRKFRVPGRGYDPGPTGIATPTAPASAPRVTPTACGTA